jgi:hypothetical protein
MRSGDHGRQERRRDREDDSTKERRLTEKAPRLWGYEAVQCREGKPNIIEVVGKSRLQSALDKKETALTFGAVGFEPDGFSPLADLWAVVASFSWSEAC